MQLACTVPSLTLVVASKREGRGRKAARDADRRPSFSTRSSASKLILVANQGEAPPVWTRLASFLRGASAIVYGRLRRNKTPRIAA
jgi:hypothetical protein